MNSTKEDTKTITKKDAKKDDKKVKASKAKVESIVKASQIEIDDLFSSIKSKSKSKTTQTKIINKKRLHVDSNDDDNDDKGDDIDDGNEHTNVIGRDRKEKKKKLTSSALLLPNDNEEDKSTYGLLTSNLAVSIISPEAPIHRYDQESGLPVYKAHLLKVGEGGGTPLCPFDCDCCF